MQLFLKGALKKMSPGMMKLSTAGKNVLTILKTG